MAGEGDAAEPTDKTEGIEREGAAGGRQGGEAREDVGGCPCKCCEVCQAEYADDDEVMTSVSVLT